MPDTLPIAIVEPRWLDDARVRLAEHYDVLPASEANGQLAGRDALLWLDTFTIAPAPLVDALQQATSVKVLTAPLAPAQVLRMEWPAFVTWARGNMESYDDWRARQGRLWAAQQAEPAVTAPDALEPDPEPTEPEIEDDDALQEFVRSAEGAEVLPELRDGSPDEPPIAQTERSTMWNTEGEPWPEPVDLWDGASLPVFDPAWLPPAIRDYLLDAAEVRGVDPAQVAVGGLTVCASLIRESIHVQMNAGGWTERARLWGAIVGEPSTRKSAGDDIAQAVLKRIANEGRRAEEEAKQAYRISERIYEQELAGYVRAKAKGDPGQQPQAPERPQSKRLWTEDATIQAVAPLLANHARGKIMLVRDELAGWFGTFDAYRNSGGVGGQDRPVWLSAYEGKDRWIDRAENGGTAIYVPSWSVCILGGIQPSVLAQISTKLGHDGMLQRFQICVSGAAKRDAKRPINPSALARWERVQRGLIELLHGDELGPIHLSPEAQEFRSTCSDWLQQALTSGLSPALCAALGKWEGLLGRVALTWHCIEAADAGQVYPAREIQRTTLAGAWAYIRNFLWPHALCFYEGVLGDEGPRNLTAELAGRVLAHQIHTLTTSWLMHRWQRWRAVKPWQKKRELLDGLEQCGWLRAVPGTGKVMTTQYRVNPAVHDGRFRRAAERYSAEIAKLRALHEARQRDPGED